MRSLGPPWLVSETLSARAQYERGRSAVVRLRDAKLLCEVYPNSVSFPNSDGPNASLSGLVILGISRGR